MDGLKQRIIGAVVLVSLAVIFIPMLFEEPVENNSGQVLPIPDKPEVPAFTIELPGDQTASGSAGSTRGDESKGNAGDYTGKGSKGILAAEKADQASQPDPPIADSGKKPAQNSVANTSAAGQEAGNQPETTTKTVTAASTKPASHAVTKQPKTSAPEQMGESRSWVVQIGTFRNRPGAIKIRDELRAIGTPAYTAEIISGGTPMLRVFAGPTETREDALALKAKVDKRYNLKSMVITYKAP